MPLPCPPRSSPPSGWLLQCIPDTVSAALCSFESVEQAVNAAIAIVQLAIPVARMELMDRGLISATHIPVYPSRLKIPSPSSSTGPLPRFRSRSNWLEKSSGITVARTSNGPMRRKNEIVSGKPATTPSTRSFRNGKMPGAGHPMSAFRYRNSAAAFSRRARCCRTAVFRLPFSARQRRATRSGISRPLYGRLSALRGLSAGPRGWY